MSRGFSLIESVLMIAVLGVLGAVAVPRFLHLPQQTLEARVKLAEADLREQVIAFRDKSLFHHDNHFSLTSADGLLHRVFVNEQGWVVDAMFEGYQSSSEASDQPWANRCGRIFVAVIEGGRSRLASRGVHTRYVPTSSRGDFTVTADSSGTRCAFSPVEDASIRVVYNLQDGTVALNRKP